MAAKVPCVPEMREKARTTQQRLYLEHLSHNNLGNPWPEPFNALLITKLLLVSYRVKCRPLEAPQLLRGYQVTAGLTARRSILGGACIKPFEILTQC